MPPPYSCSNIYIGNKPYIIGMSGRPTGRAISPHVAMMEKAAKVVVMDVGHYLHVRLVSFFGGGGGTGNATKRKYTK